MCIVQVAQLVDKRLLVMLQFYQGCQKVLKYLKMPSVKKCQAEQPVDTNQVGGDFRQQPATFDNPAVQIIILIYYNYNNFVFTNISYYIKGCC